MLTMIMMTGCEEKEDAVNHRHLIYLSLYKENTYKKAGEI
ncbi:hypothetical protein B4147_5849 [Bacillus wiedmannii]|uniref:Uncharacterized protein n=1 Tax=Bacillus wiedmannii TaxID=1890302 RepID=A0A0G8CBW8_9BACI|nr:hypothetical protein B4147_5849 [Bacillus wiedmannii]